VRARHRRRLGFRCSDRAGQSQSRAPALSPNQEFCGYQRSVYGREWLAHRQRQAPPRCHQREVRRGDQRDVWKEGVRMKSFSGKALRWEWRDGIVELTLDHKPANEIGTVMLADLEQFASAIKSLEADTSVCIISSAQRRGFCAGADLRELYHGAIALSEKQRNAGVRDFVQRCHVVANAIDSAP